MPLVTGGGLTQHYEKFTQSEFWVTPYNPTQFAAKNLPTYVAGSPSVLNRDIVVWLVYNSSHLWIGTADVMWTGFMLMPHDFFNCSPFYKPCPYRISLPGAKTGRKRLGV